MSLVLLFSVPAISYQATELFLADMQAQSTLCLFTQVFLSTVYIYAFGTVLMQENIWNVVFGIILISAQALEVYNSFFATTNLFPKPVAETLRTWGQVSLRPVGLLLTVVQDFRSRKYYKPWAQTRPVVVHSTQHVEELSDAPELSQRAVYADIFGFQYTMHHSQIHMDPNEQSAARYRLFSRSIRVVGLSQISVLHTFLQAKLENACNTHLHSSQPSDGRKSVKLASFMRNVTTGMMGVYFFGEELYEEPEFAWALSRYYKDVMTCMGALPMVPEILKPFVHSKITNNSQALNILFSRLSLSLDEKKRDWQENNKMKSVTLWHNMVQLSEESSYWTRNSLIQAIIGIWFAASHQPWMTLHFIILELCARQEYIILLRKEINAQRVLDYGTISKLPILDSFIKENLRLNPLDKMYIRRKAIKPFTFKDGLQVPLGKVACVYGPNIMLDSARYPNPLEFNGLRFVNDTLASSSTEIQDTSNTNTTSAKGMTEVSKDFIVWGFGSKACPGRWHAAMVLKMAVAHLVANYDFCVEDQRAPQRWYWETFQMAYESTEVKFRPRERE